MSKDSFNASWELIEGVKEDVESYLFITKEWKDKLDLIEEVNDAITELESWIIQIKQMK